VRGEASDVWRLWGIREVFREDGSSMACGKIHTGKVKGLGYGVTMFGFGLSW
jgi:hypothetical protein